MLLLLIFLFVPNALHTGPELVVLTLAGVTMVLLDTKAGIEQWKRLASGGKLSAILHLTVALGISAFLTADYQMAQPIGVRDWFIGENLGFVALLGVVRVVAAAVMLQDQPEKKP